jgi:hypothetical protein
MVSVVGFDFTETLQRWIFSKSRAESFDARKIPVPQLFIEFENYLSMKVFLFKNNE